MKLSKIYTNLPQYFKPIKFNDGLNIIFGKVKKIEDDKRDSHNLGKSLLVDVIDFCLLKRITSEHFTKKLPEELSEIEFYLEIFLAKEKFLTIKREIKNNTKICFKESSNSDQDLTKTHKEEWDQFELPLDRSVQYLDGELNLQAIKPFDYRKGISYFLRKQKDYDNVFQVEKFSLGKHIVWKPYIGKILGFTPEIIEKKYNYDNDIEKRNDELEQLKNELGQPEESLDKLRARREAEDQRIGYLEGQLDSFDFKEQDLQISEDELQKIDEEIAYVNNEIYNFNSDLNEIKKSLDRDISFKIENVRKIFEEIGLCFQNQILKEYRDLENFNRSLTRDRSSRLREEKDKIEKRLMSLKESLEVLNNKKISKLDIIREHDSFKKYKKMQSKLVKYKSDLQKLDDDLKKFEEIQEKGKDIYITGKHLAEIINDLRKEVDDGNNTLKNIRS